MNWKAIPKFSSNSFNIAWTVWLCLLITPLDWQQATNNEAVFLTIVICYKHLWISYGCAGYSHSFSQWLLTVVCYRANQSITTFFLSLATIWIRSLPQIAEPFIISQLTLLFNLILSSECAQTDRKKTCFSYMRIFLETNIFPKSAANRPVLKQISSTVQGRNSWG